MASVTSVLKPGELDSNGCPVPAGEVVLCLTMKEAQWLRSLVGHVSSPGNCGRSNPDYTIWQALVDGSIANANPACRFTRSGGCEEFGPDPDQYS